MAQPIASIIYNNQVFEYWEALRVTRGIEVFPSSFEFISTEKDPANPMLTALAPGGACKIQLNNTTVLTGVLGKAAPALGVANHAINISGRSRCRDIFDCSAIVPRSAGTKFTPNMNVANQVTSQISGASASDIAKTLCAPYGITVTFDPTDLGPAIPLFQISLTDTPYSIIDRVCRYAAFLFYDDVNGNLVLSRVGKNKHSSGVTQGMNCFSWAGTFEVETRHSDIYTVWNTSDTNNDLSMATGVFNNFHGHANDPGIKTFRPLIIQSDQSINGEDIAQRRAQWQMNRIIGRSQAIQVTVDSWTDNSGNLWTPNWLIDINLPSIKVVSTTWLVAEVSYMQDLQNGTSAILTLMPPQAFDIEPISLTPFAWDVAQGIQQANQAELTSRGKGL